MAGETEAIPDNEVPVGAPASVVTTGEYGMGNARDEMGAGTGVAEPVAEVVEGGTDEEGLNSGNAVLTAGSASEGRLEAPAAGVDCDVSGVPADLNRGV